MSMNLSISLADGIRGDEALRAQKERAPGDLLSIQCSAEPVEIPPGRTQPGKHRHLMTRLPLPVSKS